MVFSIPSVLTTEELNFVAKRLDDADFIDSKTTAGWHARLIKHNTQHKTQTTYTQDLKELVKTTLWRNPLFQMAVRLKIIHSLLFSRYEAGMSYATYLDNALMGNQEKLGDISLTLFLNKFANYQGGELVIREY